jgi:hypothetical protein
MGQYVGAADDPRKRLNRERDVAQPLTGSRATQPDDDESGSAILVPPR